MGGLRHRRPLYSSPRRKVLSLLQYEGLPRRDQRLELGGPDSLDARRLGDRGPDHDGRLRARGGVLERVLLYVHLARRERTLRITKR
ncbi:hypothetical protein D3C80_1754500 [compost metagenome]